MKPTVESTLALAALLLWVLHSAAQTPQEPAQPTFPKDRVNPAGEINGKTDQTPITLRIMGATMRDNQGSPLGRVEDVVVDPSSGKIEFLIVSAYFPSNSTKLTPVPWRALNPRPQQNAIGTMAGANQVFALNFPREKFQQAPNFERYRWPDMGQSGWRQPIYEFYSVQTGTGATGAEVETQTGVGTSVGPGTSTAPSADPSVPSAANRTNSVLLQTNVASQVFGPAIPPGINPRSSTRTNASSIPDNRLPIGKRL